MDRYREDIRGSVANMSSLRVSSRGSTISGSAAWLTWLYYKPFIPAHTQDTWMSQSRQRCSLRTPSVNTKTQRIHTKMWHSPRTLGPPTSYPYLPVPSFPVQGSSCRTSIRKRACSWSCERRIGPSMALRRTREHWREQVTRQEPTRTLGQGFRIDSQR